MSPSAFRFSKTWFGFQVNPSIARNDSEPTDCVRVSSPSHSQDAAKSFLGAIRELVTGLLVVFVYPLLLEDFSSVVFDHTH